MGLWSYGYYDQGRDEDRYLKVEFRRKRYYFLEDLGVSVTVDINGKPVIVKAYLVPSNLFNSAPSILLSTDVEGNDYLSRTITHKLYDQNNETRVAQEIVLGIGGAKILEALKYEPEIYHMNEGHSSPMAFELYNKHKSLDEVKKRLVFTTHTPEAAGNEEHNIDMLKRMGFFAGSQVHEVREVTGIQGDNFSLTVGALKMAKIANGVSKIHAEVANEMWDSVDGRCEIIPIT